jgi:hypothetical protein
MALVPPPLPPEEDEIVMTEVTVALEVKPLAMAIALLVVVALTVKAPAYLGDEVVG